MKASIVTIGDEILIGQITDTNSVWIAQQLLSLGIQLTEMLSIADNAMQIRETLDRLIGKTDLLLITGGLGPTKDDITKQTLADYFGAKLELDQKILNKIESYFKGRGRKMIASNRLQAYVPDNCSVLANNYGTAPGMWFRKDNTHIISMPGVPYEMKPMVSEQLIPALTDYIDVPELLYKTIMTEGVPESYLAALIRNWEDQLPECMKLAYLPRPGIVRLRLTVSGMCVETADKLFDEHIKTLNERIGDHIFSYEDEYIEEVIAKILKDKKLSVSTAESCTGGNIAKLLTSVPGSSSYFKGSVIAYSNEIKEKLLDVAPGQIKEEGAVSKDVVEAMASGALKYIGTDLAMATSGIAGPDGGTMEKPIGTVWIAVASKKRIYSKKYQFGGHRDLVIEQASIMAIAMLRKLILDKLQD